MLLLYNIGIALYCLGLHLAAPFYPKARQLVRGHRGALRQLRQAMRSCGSRKVVWFHCASLGEFEQGRPIIEKLREQQPEAFILLTFFSPSGYNVRKAYAGADYVSYLPLDLWWRARRFVRIASPSVAIFVKYEFWHHYFSTLKRQGIKIYVASAIFREQQVFFLRPFGAFFVKILRCCEHIFVQNEASLQLLASVGIHNATCAGDTRFDRVLATAGSASALPQLADFAASAPLTLVAGSTWPPDERLIASLVNSTPRMKLIIAPHEVSESRVQALIALLEKPALRYSHWQKNQHIDLAAVDVFVVDTVGLLSSLYRFGSIAYIGGGFGAGIHNVLEAAVFGIPVVFGPRYQKFREARDLVSAGGAFSIASLPELQRVVGTLYTDPKRCTQSGSICREYVQQHRGATDMILNSINL